MKRWRWWNGGGGGGNNCCGDREGEGCASSSNVGVVIVKIVRQYCELITIYKIFYEILRNENILNKINIKNIFV